MRIADLLHPTQANGEAFPPDSAKSLVIVVAASFIQFFPIGNIFTFNLMVPVFLESFNGTSLSQISAVGTTGFALFFFGGLIAAPLANKRGPRIVTLVGGTIWFVGYFFSTYAQTFPQLVFTYGVLLGFGSSFAYWALLSTLPQWFEKYRFVGTSVALMAGGIGQIVYAFGFAKYLINTEWKRTIQVLASCGLACILISCPFLSPRTPQHRQVDLKATIIELLHDRNYIFYLLAAFFTAFTCFVPFLNQ